MSRPVLLTAALLCGTIPCGCLARQVHRDGNGLRNAVADLYTDQAMDNLIRAHGNMPFVHLKFSGLNVSDTDDYSAAPSFTQVVDMAARAVTNTYKSDGTVDRKRTMTFNADPITDENDVYTAYIQFASDPGLFVASDFPPDCPVHLHRKRGKRHYWVPCEAGPAFLQLVLQTSLMRGPETAPAVPAAYEVKIVQVVNPVRVEGRDIANATLVFEKPVPNGEATLVFDMDNGRRVRAALWPVDKDAEGKRVDLGQPMTRLDIQWAPKRDNFDSQDLLNRPARVYSRDYPPEVAVHNPVLRRLSTDVNQIKINQFSGRR